MKLVEAFLLMCCCLLIAGIISVIGFIVILYPPAIGVFIAAILLFFLCYAIVLGKSE